MAPVQWCLPTHQIGHRAVHKVTCPVRSTVSNWLSIIKQHLPHLLLGAVNNIMPTVAVCITLINGQCAMAKFLKSGV